MARRIVLKVPTRLISTARLNSERGMGPFFVRALPATPTPAQLMSALMPPKASTTRSSARRVLSSPVTSASAKITFSPSSEASFSPRAAWRSRMATRAPSPERSRTQASPSPEAPPVITAKQSLVFTGFRSFCVSETVCTKRNLLDPVHQEEERKHAEGRNRKLACGDRHAVAQMPGKHQRLAAKEWLYSLPYKVLITIETVHLGRRKADGRRISHHTA